jgi:hypothetical protein
MSDAGWWPVFSQSLDNTQVDEIYKIFVAALPSGEARHAVSAFLKAVCRRAKARSVLEYTVAPTALSTAIIENNDVDLVQLVSPVDTVAKELAARFQDRPVSVSQEICRLDPLKRFDIIICQPPVGEKRSEEPAADGFGGEVVRKLAPLLTENGTLYWITARKILFATPPNETLSDLARSGFNKTAVIDLAPGFFFPHLN